MLPGFENLQYVSICSDNGVVPSRQQAITWINDDTVHWHMYASPGLIELKQSLVK